MTKKSKFKRSSRNFDRSVRFVHDWSRIELYDEVYDRKEKERHDADGSCLTSGSYQDEFEYQFTPESSDPFSSIVYLIFLIIVLFIITLVFF